MKVDFSSVTMPYGQHMGVKLKDLPIDYLSKLMDGDNNRPAWLQSAIEQEWERRKTNGGRDTGCLREG